MVNWNKDSIRARKEDDEMWQWAKGLDTVSAYESYLATYDTHSDGGCRGTHVADAHARVTQLRAEGERLKRELLDEMRCSPWEFPADCVISILRGVDDPETLRVLREQDDVVSRFIVSGQTISFRELQEQGIVPATWTEERFIAPDAYVEYTPMCELGRFPTDGRTDIYFMGIPGCGKTAVMTGILYEMYRSGQSVYEPLFNDKGVDNSFFHYNRLLRSVLDVSFPMSIGRYATSFMKIRLTKNNRQNPLTFVDMAGQEFWKIGESINVGAETLQEIGVIQCLHTKNRKLLAFIVDYEVRKSSVYNNNCYYKGIDRILILDYALQVLGHDGRGTDGTDGCTLSRVDIIAVIVTKSDLMGDNLIYDERSDLAMRLLNEKYRTFMNNVSDLCAVHGINKQNGNRPYVFTFSIGKLMIGNKYLYDSTDSERLVDFISKTTRSFDM